MDRVTIQKAYNGYISDESVLKTVEEYFNILKNNKESKKLANTNLIIVSNDKDQAIDFAKSTANFLHEQKITGSPRIINLGSDNLTSIKKSLEDIIVINNFDENIKWTDLLANIDSIDKVIILCTTPATCDRYKETDTINKFYDIFSKQVELKTYTVSEICNASIVFFEQLKSNGTYSTIDDSFYPALEKYIKTIYGRAVLQGKAFVEDLESRITKRSYEVNTPLELSENTIPEYQEQESTEETERNIKEYFCFSSDIKLILENANACVTLKDAKNFTEYKPTINLNISGYSFEQVETFANIYARLLNSDKYNLIPAKDLMVMNLFDVMREKDNFQNKNGLILLKDFELLKDFDNANDVVEQLIEIINNSKGIAWILYGHHKFEELMNANNVTKLKEIFNKEYSLDSHDKDSSENYIKYCYATKQITDIPLKVPKKLNEELVDSVLKANNQKEATLIIEEYIVSHLKETDDFDEVKTKEEEIRNLVENVKIDESDKKEVNVLLLAMSTLNNVSVSSYTYKDGNADIQGKYVSSLEPVPKALAEIFAHNNSKLDAIYVLNTKKTVENIKGKLKSEITQYSDTNEEYSAYSYFVERCSCLIDKKNIFSIELEKNNDESKTDVESALYELSQKLNDYLLDGNKVNLYVDIHGGLRAPQTIVDAILMLIKDIDNIELKDIYTGAFSQGMFPIISAKNDFEIFNFVSGMREFLSFGRSNGLVEFNHTRENKQISTELVDGINDISDSIVLNRMEKFGDNLKNLSDLVNTKDKEKGYYDTIKSLIRSNYRVNINNHSYDLLNEVSINFPAQLQWCLDKNLLQQALMLIENRTSDALEEFDVLCKKTIKRGKRNIKLDLLGNWVKYSLAIENVGWAKKEQGKHENETKPIDNAKILCYQSMNQNNLFENIDILESKEIKEDIRNKRNNIGTNYPNEYFECFEYEKNKNDIENEYYIKKSGFETKYAHLEKIPINEQLLDSQSFLDSFYILLYVYKNLKWYRNTVAHPEKIDDLKDLKVEEVRAWIAFYIEIFMEVLDKAKEILDCKDSKQEETSGKISMEDAISNLENRFGSKHENKRY